MEALFAVSRLEVERPRNARWGWFSPKTGLRAIGGWVQLVVWVMMIVQPVRFAHAEYDPNDPAVQEMINNGTLVWWGGANATIDGLAVSVPAQYHLAVEGDNDGDLIPNDLDPYPNDANNHSVHWSGGTFPIAGVSMNFPAQYYASDGWTDNDNDGIPNELDPYVNDSFNNNPMYLWAGGTYWVNNGWMFFHAQYFLGWSAVDADADGLPDPVDPYPADANNGNDQSFFWMGGEYLISAVPYLFAAAWYNGSWMDTDWDGIPDGADPFPAIRKITRCGGAAGRFWWTAII
jgi:hypothetical protein